MIKLLQDMLSKAGKHFQEGGKLKLLGPIFRANENFFFAGKAKTTVAPHIRDPLDVKRYMSMVIVAVAPCVMAAVYFYGLRVLAMIVVSYAAGGVVEVIFAMVRKEEINEGFLVTGLLFPLILPPGLPLWVVAVGVAFGVFVGKELFGGTGRNVFNPALVGRCFLALSYPKAMTEGWIAPGGGLFGRAFEYVGVSSAGADAVSSATPLVLAKQGQLTSLTDMLFGRTAGCMGETFALGIIAGGIFLCIVRVANWRTVAASLGSFALMAWLLAASNPDTYAPALWHLSAGGILFGAFFMATDPVTSPATNGGKWVYGIVIGVVTVLIRNLTGFVEGAMFAILLGNMAAPILDEIVIAARLRRLRYEG